MKKYFLIFGFIFFGVLAYAGISKAATFIGFSEREEADDVIQVFVTNHSRYILDTRYYICFYETTNGAYGVSVVQITDENICVRMITKARK